jgi:hypothetical protein
MKPVIKLPDLIVQKFVLSPSSVQNGEYLDYELIIKNTGGKASLGQMLVGFNITLQYARSDYLSVPGPGQSLTFKGSLSAPADKCMVLTWMDNTRG